MVCLIIHCVQQNRWAAVKQKDKLYPLRGWNPENDIFYSLAALAVQAFLRSFGNTEILCTPDAPSSTEHSQGLVLSQGSNSSVQAGSSTGGTRLCCLSYILTSCTHQTLHSMQVNTFLSIARGENVMIEAW